MRLEYYAKHFPHCSKMPANQGWFARESNPIVLKHFVHPRLTPGVTVRVMFIRTQRNGVPAGQASLFQGSIMFHCRVWNLHVGESRGPLCSTTVQFVKWKCYSPIENSSGDGIGWHPMHRGNELPDNIKFVGVIFEIFRATRHEKFIGVNLMATYGATSLHF